jgi:hypothetical protein
MRFFMKLNLFYRGRLLIRNNLRLLPAPTADRLVQNARQQLFPMANVAVILLASADGWRIAISSPYTTTR